MRNKTFFIVVLAGIVTMYVGSTDTLIVVCFVSESCAITDVKLPNTNIVLSKTAVNFLIITSILH